MSAREGLMADNEVLELFLRIDELDIDVVSSSDSIPLDR